MTREEAVNYLQGCAKEAKDKGWGDGIRFALATLNSALSAEPCDNKNEVMDFPKTWEEYEEYYGFNDTEEVYSNNIRLIPSLRVKQWLDHLEQEPCEKTQMVDKSTFSQEQYRADLQSAFDCGKASVECEDAVSRQVVLDTLDNTDKFMDEDRTVETYKALLKECYEVLPSVTPKQETVTEFADRCRECGSMIGRQMKQRTGHWILTDDNFVYCSECEDSYYPRPIDASWYYCPHCGAKMESEDK